MLQQYLRCDCVKRWPHHTGPPSLGSRRSGLSLCASDTSPRNSPFPVPPPKQSSVTPTHCTPHAKLSPSVGPVVASLFVSAGTVRPLVL